MNRTLDPFHSSQPCGCNKAGTTVPNLQQGTLSFGQDLGLENTKAKEDLKEQEGLASAVLHQILECPFYLKPQNQPGKSYPFPGTEESQVPRAPASLSGSSTPGTQQGPSS